MEFIDKIASCIPVSVKDEIPWDAINRLFDALPYYSGLKFTMQNPAYHGEGDVYTHTQMVCSELVKDSAFFELPDIQRIEMFLAAVLHDIGKVKTTRLDDGNWVSPHHGPTGSQIAEAFLWQECGICGTRDMLEFRQTVCTLIRYHMLPVHIISQEKPEQRVRKVAAIGELAKDFSWHMLCMLARADVKGRIANDTQKGLEKVALAEMLAEEAECLNAPYRFADSFTKRAYLSGRNVQPNQTLYDDTWGEVILLSGLPGTGKDTWIKRNHLNTPMVSLDAIRAELKLKPTDNQGKVIQTAQRLAKEYLRKKQPFIWNATNLTQDTRQRLIDLFEAYGARARIVYLETDWKTREERNASRLNSVPEAAVAQMLEKTVLPTPDEAHSVEWLCV